jgi:hypothetical protein
MVMEPTSMLRCVVPVRSKLALATVQVEDHLVAPVTGEAEDPDLASAAFPGEILDGGAVTAEGNYAVGVVQAVGEIGQAEGAVLHLQTAADLGLVEGAADGSCNRHPAGGKDIRAEVFENAEVDAAVHPQIERIVPIELDFAADGQVRGAAHQVSAFDGEHGIGQGGHHGLGVANDERRGASAQWKGARRGAELEFRNPQLGLERLRAKRGAIDAQPALGETLEGLGRGGFRGRDPLAQAGVIEPREGDVGAAGIIALQEPRAVARNAGAGHVRFQMRL